ncbi:hypothetical protein fragment [Helicobacter acinonychis str. Sheeba]|uniref:Uncharacterized protein n=1 Tax=Helicobacter acinonychis (strain Sheeba) TaxID=382638 RepID=Q17Y21_HELAH|nr:hypothetical protein fragment [Helicobacter acinonychis str. Sheeba]
MATGYGIKKGIDAIDDNMNADDIIKKAEDLQEATKKRA